MTNPFPCSADPDLFFAPDGQHTDTDAYRARAAAAKALCAGCPNRLPCLRQGREERHPGIWGGEDDNERAWAGFKPRTMNRVPAACGTAAGAKRHSRKGTKACRPCLDAANAVRRENEARQQDKLATAA